MRKMIYLIILLVFTVLTCFFISDKLDSGTKKSTVEVCENEGG